MHANCLICALLLLCLFHGIREETNKQGIKLAKCGIAMAVPAAWIPTAQRL